MLNDILDWLREINITVWIFAPTLLLFLIIHILTGKVWKNTLAIVGIIILAAIGTSGFYAWQVYLSNHFVGSYDAQGIPYQFSGPGWDFFTTAWPLWFIPAVIAIILLFLFKFYFFKKSSPVSIDWSLEEAPHKAADKYIQQQFEIQRLKQTLEYANEALTKLGASPIQIETRPIEDEMSYEEYSVLRHLQDELANLTELTNALTKQNTNFKNELSEKEIELSRVKNMLRTLVQRT